ncbi:MAG: TetR/AcrR family transcriptional regulator, partial [Hyphomicrobiaceae bacterium]
MQAPYRTKMRDSMVMIASRIVNEEGLAAVQARRISQEAGCAVGTLYNVFGGLDYLIIEANAATLATLGEALARADAASGNPAAPLAQRLLALANAYLRFANDNSKAWRAVFEHHMTPGTEVPAWYRERQGGLFALIESLLKDVVADRATRGSAARALFSAVHGIVAISLDQKLGDFDLAEAERQVQFVVKSVANGLTGPSTITTN